jgi:glycosyltransferase involved in cell wall biosynthesis
MKIQHVSLILLKFIYDTVNISEINGCVIVPTYNNDKTLARVLNGILELIPAERLIVVNDGATDTTAEILEDYADNIHVLVNEPNQGKGFALRKGLKKAIELGYDNAITIDSDGQHFPSDLPLMINMAIENPGTVLMGSRNMQQEGVPQKSSFGNKFSNFWFKLETGITLPDTQTGFRLYPLEPLKRMRLFTRKFELEIEIIVRLAWRGVPFKPVSIQVKYDPEERVSHFRPGRDFFRISVLNSVLVLFALLYYYPKKLFSLNTLAIIKQETIKPEESNFSKALSIGFGVFMGIVPIWGFQLLVGIPLAVLFRMNKVLFIAAANISVPPMIPFIIYGSFLMGQQFIDGATNTDKIFAYTTSAISENLQQYMIGAVLLAIVAFLSAFVISYVLLKMFRKEPVNK